MVTHSRARIWDAAMLLFAALFPALGTWLYFVTFAGQEEVKPVYVASKALQFAFPLIWVWLIQRRSIRLEALRRSAMTLGLIFGLAVAGAMLAGYFGFLRDSKYLAGADAAVGGKIEEIGCDSPGLYLLLAVFYSVPHAFLEEYYWRWFLYGQLRRWRRAAGFSPAAAGLSGAAFALHHVIVIGSYLPAEHFWTATLFFSLCVAVGGAVFAWLYERSAQLYAPWLSHLLIDAGIMLVGFDLCWRHWNP